VPLTPSDTSDTIAGFSLAADFEAMMQASIAKEVSDVAPRVWTPQRARVRFGKQVAPTVEDLTGQRAVAYAHGQDHTVL
jgi:hypothetical protein